MTNRVDLEALRALAAKSAALIAECPFNAPGYRAEKCKRCGATQSDSCGVHDSATNQFYNTMSVAFPALADEIERLREALSAIETRIATDFMPYSKCLADVRDIIDAALGEAR